MQCLLADGASATTADRFRSAQSLGLGYRLILVQRFFVFACFFPVTALPLGMTLVCTS